MAVHSILCTELDGSLFKLLCKLDRQEEANLVKKNRLAVASRRKEGFIFHRSLEQARKTFSTTFVIARYACNIEEVLGISTGDAVTQSLLRLPSPRCAPGRRLWLQGRFILVIAAVVVFEGWDGPCKDELLIVQSCSFLQLLVTDPGIVRVFILLRQRSSPGRREVVIGWSLHEAGGKSTITGYNILRNTCRKLG